MDIHFIGSQQPTISKSNDHPVNHVCGKHRNYESMRKAIGLDGASLLLRKIRGRRQTQCERPVEFPVEVRFR